MAALWPDQDLQPDQRRQHGSLASQRAFKDVLSCILLELSKDGEAGMGKAYILNVSQSVLADNHKGD